MTTAPFLTIKEAADRYHRSEITIRRFVRTVLEERASEERKHVRPAPTAVEKFQRNKRPYAYTISVALLEQKFAADASFHHAKEHAKDSLPPSEYVILLEKTNTSLLGQLTVKDGQIQSLSASLEDLSERQRETNVLMKIMQERLLLPERALPRRRFWKLWRK